MLCDLHLSRMVLGLKNRPRDQVAQEGVFDKVWVAVQGPEKRAEYNIKDNLIRFSCGVESAEDIWQDLVQALAKI